MKDFFKLAGVALIFLGWVVMAFAVISGIGYGLYLLGAVGLTFGLSAWLGFVLWLKLTVGGFVSLVIGAILAAI